MNFGYYTERELRKIHRTFGHPSVGATTGILTREKVERIDRETRQTIE